MITKIETNRLLGVEHFLLSIKALSVALWYVSLSVSTLTSELDYINTNTPLPKALASPFSLVVSSSFLLCGIGLSLLRFIKLSGKNTRRFPSQGRTDFQELGSPGRAQWQTLNATDIPIFTTNIIFLIGIACINTPAYSFGKAMFITSLVIDIFTARHDQSRYKKRALCLGYSDPDKRPVCDPRAMVPDNQVFDNHAAISTLWGHLCLLPLITADAMIKQPDRKSYAFLLYIGLTALGVGAPLLSTVLQAVTGTIFWRHDHSPACPGYQPRSRRNSERRMTENPMKGTTQTTLNPLSTVSV